MVYFISDAHLGSRALTSMRTRERRLVKFLDSIKHKASAVYMLGDIFDFWFEYHNVVPKGYTRFLGKLSELSDQGIELHFYVGNHDMWAFDYLHHECGMTIHPEPEELLLPCVDGSSQVAFIGHGDGLGDKDRKFLFLRSMFHNPLLQRLFACIHPSWSVGFGLEWAKRSRLKHEAEGAPRYLGEQQEPLIQYSKQYLEKHPDINYFIYGHRHIELDLMLNRDSRIIILGDCWQQFTYAQFDNFGLRLLNYEQ